MDTTQFIDKFNTKIEETKNHFYKNNYSHFADYVNSLVCNKTSNIVIYKHYLQHPTTMFPYYYSHTQFCSKVIELPTEKVNTRDFTDNSIVKCYEIKQELRSIKEKAMLGFNFEIIDNCIKDQSLYIRISNPYVS